MLLQLFPELMIRILVSVLSFLGLMLANQSLGGSKFDSLRELIVSHTDKNGILQLFRMNEDGSDSLQLTDSMYGC